MSLRNPTIGAMIAAAIAVATINSCGGSYTPPAVSFPTVEFVTADGTTLSCSADAGGSLCCPSGASGLVANGVDVGILRIINHNGADVAPDKYQIVVASTEGKVTFGQPVLVGDAGMLQASSTVTFPVSLPGQQNDILVHAGTESGEAHIAVTIGSETQTYCLSLSPSDPVQLSVQVGPTPTNGAPANWTSYQITVSMEAVDGGHVSDSVLLNWTATGCALLAATTTDLPASGSTQNTVYLPPGWTQSEVTVSVANPSGPAKAICLTPGGGAAPVPLDGGVCPAVAVPDAGSDAGVGLTVVCPSLRN